jgi:Zn-dependent protease
MSWSGPYDAPWSVARPVGRITTSRTEVLHLGVAYLVLTVCLILIFSGNTFLGSGFAPPGVAGIDGTVVAVSALAALTGFVAHEMAHKVAAQRRGFWAEFRGSAYGLLMALGTSIVGFIFAAPGATVVGGISGLDLRSWGRTSLAGPMTNVAFATLFYGAAVGADLAHSGLLVWLMVLAFINAWFGTFNLAPWGILDGFKVFRWDRGVWAAAMGVALTALAFTGLALYGYGSPLLAR